MPEIPQEEGIKAHVVTTACVRGYVMLVAITSCVCMCSGKEVGTAAARFYHILSAAYATGEYNKVFQGERDFLHLFF